MSNHFYDVLAFSILIGFGVVSGIVALFGIWIASWAWYDKMLEKRMDKRLGAPDPRTVRSCYIDRQGVSR